MPFCVSACQISRGNLKEALTDKIVGNKLAISTGNLKQILEVGTTDTTAGKVLVKYDQRSSSYLPIIKRLGAVKPLATALASLYNHTSYITLKNYQVQYGNTCTDSPIIYLGDDIR